MKTKLLPGDMMEHRCCKGLQMCFRSQKLSASGKDALSCGMTRLMKIRRNTHPLNPWLNVTSAESRINHSRQTVPVVHTDIKSSRHGHIFQI